MSRKIKVRSHRHKTPKKVLQVRWLRKLYALEPNVQRLSIEAFSRLGHAPSHKA